MKQYLASKLAKSALDAQRQSFALPQKRPTLNRLKMPGEIEHMFPNKVRVYTQMRETEDNINAFMKQRLLAAKEDLLQNISRVKRNMRIMVEITHSLPSTKHLSSSDWRKKPSSVTAIGSSTTSRNSALSSPAAKSSTRRLTG